MAVIKKMHAPLKSMACWIIVLVVLLHQSRQSLAADCLTAKDDDRCYQFDEPCNKYKRWYTYRDDCTEGRVYHCLRNVNTGKFVEGCFKPVDCPIGTEPLMEYIPEARVVCKTCKNELRFNPVESTPSDKYSECPRTRDACSPDEGKFKCDPNSAKDNHSTYFLCRCDVRRGYGRYGKYNKSQPVCSYDQAYECLKLCGEDEDVSLEGYRCLNKTCPEGSSRTDEYSDDCIRSPDKIVAPVTTKTPQDRTVASMQTTHVTKPTTARPVSTESKTTTKSPQDDKDGTGEEGHDSSVSKWSVAIPVGIGFGIAVVVIIVGVTCWYYRKKLRVLWKRILLFFRRKQNGPRPGAGEHPLRSIEDGSERESLIDEEEANQYEGLSDQQKSEMLEEAIGTNHDDFVLDMDDPKRILDSFRQKKLLDRGVIRNIREKNETSEMNRHILDRVNSWEKYCIFKQILKDIHYDALCRKFEDTERSYYDRIIKQDQISIVSSGNTRIDGSSDTDSNKGENNDRVNTTIPEVVVHYPHSPNSAHGSCSTLDHENNGGPATTDVGGHRGKSNSASNMKILDKVVHHSEMHPPS